MDLAEVEDRLRTLLLPVCEPLHGMLEEAAAITDGHLELYEFPEREGRTRTDIIRAHLGRLLRARPIEGFHAYVQPGGGRLMLISDEGPSLLLLSVAHGERIPHPGPNTPRRRYWTNGDVRLLDDYELSTLLGVFQVLDGTARVRIARPIRPWPWKGKPEVDLHFVLPRTAAALQALAFTPSDDEIDLRLPEELDTDVSSEMEAGQPTLWDVPDDGQ